MMSESTNAFYTHYYSASDSIYGTDTGETEYVDSDYDSTSLGKDEFLTLLMAELQNQDPLDPMDNTEWISQLAEFSSLEQMTSMNESLQEMIESNEAIADSVYNSMLINYAGQEVTADSSIFYYQNGDDIDLNFTLGSDLSTGTMTIVDPEGNIIRQLTMDDFESGDNTVTWNGIMDDGTLASTGPYAYTIEGYTEDGESVSVSATVTGIVDGITYVYTKPYLKIGDTLVDIEDISLVTNMVTDSTEE